MLKPKVIILMGPTASGKTGLAVRLAQKLDGEIISADSRQVYRGMDIGTGKDLNEYENVPYHLIDVIDAGKEFSVSDFQKLAWQALTKTTEKNKLPIICGGTGHYIKALLENYRFDHKKTDLTFSRQLESLTINELHTKLRSLGIWNDHDWKHDSKRRMARAIEKSLGQKKKSSEMPSFAESFDHRIYYIDLDRTTLKARILHRLQQRLAEGMVEETMQLLEQGITHQRLERFGLEYKHLSHFICGKITKEELIKNLNVEIARFAKRQMTFLRYLQKNGHKMIAIKNFEDLWSNIEEWIKGRNERLC